MSNVAQIPTVYLRADAVTLADESARTVQVDFYSGSPVIRGASIFDDAHELEFSLAPGAADLSRMNGGGAALTRDHSKLVADQVGVVERAWIDGAAKAVVRFSKRADVEPLYQDVRDRVVRNVSMEAQIIELEDVTPKGAAIKRYRATKWAALALSVVSTQADPGAHFRASAETETHPCVIQRRKDMDTQTPEEIKAERDELKRCEQIRKSVAIANLSADFADELITEELSVKDAGQRIIAKLAERSAQAHAGIPYGGARILAEYDSPHAQLAAQTDAIAARARGVEPPDHAKRFAFTSTVDLARTCLAKNGLDRAHGLSERTSAARIIELALTTSDYPTSIGSTAHKVLVPAYENAAPTYRALLARRNLRDFKAAKVINVGDYPQLFEVGEGGEIQLGYFGDRGETYTLATYGRRINVSRQLLVNDDVGVIAQVFAGAGARVADFENGIFFTALTSNSGVGPTLADGGAFFNATAVTTAGGHDNYTSSGTAISDTTITVGATKMARQTGGGSTGLGDGIKLNIKPAYILAAPEKRSLTFQYTSANYVPAAATSQNAWAGVLTPLLDANLTGNRWYLLADPALNPVGYFGTLESEPGPRIATRAGFEIEGVDVKVAIDFGLALTEWRAAYANAGA